MYLCGGVCILPLDFKTLDRLTCMNWPLNLTLSGMVLQKKNTNIKKGDFLDLFKI